MKEDLYTGYLQYKEIDFAFVFDGEELRLIPPKGMESICHEWVMTPIGNGVYTYSGDKPQMEVDYLVGNCTASGKEIVFLSRVGAKMGLREPLIKSRYAQAPIAGIIRVSSKGGALG